MVLRKSGRVGSRHFRRVGVVARAMTPTSFLSPFRYVGDASGQPRSGVGSAVGTACTRLLFVHCRSTEGDVPSLRQGIELEVLFSWRLLKGGMRLDDCDALLCCLSRGYSLFAGVDIRLP